jgi:hypothetical protein
MPVSTPSLRSTLKVEATATGVPSGTATGEESGKWALSVSLNWVMLMFIPVVIETT